MVIRSQAPTSWDYGQAAKDGRASIDKEFHLAVENFFGSRLGRYFLRWLSAGKPAGTILERVIRSYADPQISLGEKFLFWPIHKLIRRMKGSATDESFRQKVAQHSSTVRGIVLTSRSVAEFGLTVPQKFVAPLIVVWNFTNQCNLHCRHCYQSSGSQPQADELSLAEKLQVVDELGKAYVPMIAFAGGEPTMSKDLLAVLKRCQSYGIHTTVATNGTMLSTERVRALRDAGVRYVEVSLDSTDSDKHDAFRGQSGVWERTVQGIKNVAAVEGIRPGLAMCVHQDNYDEVEDMIELSESLGVTCFAHFNFIPVGRGKDFIEQDLSPQQREDLLRLLNGHSQEGKIGILSTAPQFGRVALAFEPLEGRMSVSHAGGGGGLAARVVAKYLGGCGAGRTYICLEPNGDVAPCVYMPNRPFGNIRQRSLLELFRSSPYWQALSDRSDRNGHCQVCRYKNFCGGCRARADAYFGSIKANDPGCIFNQAAWDELINSSSTQACPQCLARA